MKYKTHIQFCAWIMLYIFLVQYGEFKVKHLILLLVVTMPYACWYLWRADYIEEFKWRLRFQFGVAFWRVDLREVHYEGLNRIWRALKTSILDLPKNQLFVADEPVQFDKWLVGVQDVKKTTDHFSRLYIKYTQTNKDRNARNWKC